MYLLQACSNADEVVSGDTRHRDEALAFLHFCEYSHLLAQKSPHCKLDMTLTVTLEKFSQRQAVQNTAIQQTDCVT